MSNKNILKDKIKKPNATQAFFNSYDKESNDNNNDNKDDIENKNIKDDNIENINNNYINNNIENKTYVKDNNVVNVNNEGKDNDDDYFRSLALGKKTLRKKPKKVFTSFYMDPDLAAEVDKIATRGEKGDKSKLINKAIRSLLEEYGVIEIK